VFGNAGVEQLYQVGALGIVTIRRAQQPRRLVDGQQVLVLKQNRDFPEFVCCR